MKHKHYEAIIAYANGAKIEYRDSTHPKSGWVEVANPGWLDRCEYRVKKPTIQYRLYEYHNTPDHYFAVFTNETARVRQIEASVKNGSAKWLSDWLQVTPE